MRTPRKAPLGLDPQPEVIAHLGERRLEQLRADVETLPERANPGEPGERTGTSASTRRGGDDLLEQRPRPLRLARLEVALGGLDPSSARIAGVRAGGEPASLFPKGRRRIRGTAGPCPLGGLVELGRDGRIGSLGGQREMPGAFLRIVEDGREARVQPAPLRGCRVRVEHGCQERVGEAQSLAVDLEHACLDGLVQVCDAGAPARGGLSELDRRPWDHRDDQCDVAGRRRERRKTLTDQQAQIVGNRKRPARGQRDLALEHASRDLEGEEGIAPRGSVQLLQRGTVELGVEARAKQPIQRFDIEWSDREPLETVARQGSFEVQRGGVSRLPSLGHEEPDRLLPEPAGNELECARRRWIEPLDVIHGHHDRPGLGQ